MRSVNPRLIFVVATVAMAFAGFGVALALLPDRIDELGYDDRMLGVAAGIFPVAAIAGRLGSGWLIDRFGSRLAMAVGVVLTTGGSFLLAAPGLGGLLAARALQGFGDGVLYTAAAACALDLVPHHRRSQALGWLSAGIWTGLSLGTAIGPVLGTLERAGVILGAIGLLAMGVLPLLPRGITEMPEGEARTLVAREAIRPGAVVGLTNLGYAAIVGFAVRLVADRFDHGNWVVAAFGVSLLLVRGLLGFLADRIPPRFGLNMAHSLLAFGLLLIAVSPSLPVAMVGALICALGHSFPFPILVTTTLDQVGEHRRGAVIGTLTTGFDITVAVALFAYGMLSTSFGTTSVYVVAIVGMAVAHIVSRPLELQRRAPEPVAISG